MMIRTVFSRSILLFSSLRRLLRSRSALVLENLALRQQLAALKNRRPRPSLSRFDRVFWVILLRFWEKWRDSLIIVKPETVIGWHREGFRRYWRWKSRSGRRRGRPRIKLQIRELIERMAKENPTWHAPRIHGELLMLGLDVSERTVSRYLRRMNRGRPKIQTWSTFQRNHRELIAAMDFFVVPTVRFRLLYGFFVISHDRREILHVNVSEHPTSAWVGQQLREAFPDETSCRYLIHDRDTIFGKRVDETIASFGMKPIRIACRSPWQNGVAERWVGSCRREILDHVIVLNEKHLQRLIREYVDYYNRDRCHCSLDKDAPTGRQVQRQDSSIATVKSMPRLGGLHHRCEWREAA